VIHHAGTFVQQSKTIKADPKIKYYNTVHVIRHLRSWTASGMYTQNMKEIGTQQIQELTDPSVTFYVYKTSSLYNNI